MPNVIVSPAAFTDLQSLRFYLEQDFGEAVAVAKLRRLYKVLKRLETFPSMGRRRDQIHAGFHSFAVSPNVIMYRFVSENTVEIVRVVDGRVDLEALFRADETAENI